MVSLALDCWKIVQNLTSPLMYVPLMQNASNGFSDST
jgi:hypothetical protein